MAGTIKLDGTTFLSKSGSDFTLDVGSDGTISQGTFNGALGSTHTSAKAGTFELITTVSANDASTVSFNSTYITSAHDSYQIHVSGLGLSSGTASSNMRLRFGYGGTPTYFSNVRFSCFHNQIDGTGLVNVLKNQGTTYFELNTNLDDNGAGVCFILDFVNLNGVDSQYASIINRGFAMLRSEGNSYSIWGAGVWDQGGNPTTHIEYSHAAGTFEGTFKLYGIRN